MEPRYDTHEILLKLGDCPDREALHDRLRDTFGFPAYYGRNWDALWDCLGERFLPSEPCRLIVEGLGALPEALSGPLRRIFADLTAQYPWVSVSYRTE